MASIKLLALITVLVAAIAVLQLLAVLFAPFFPSKTSIRVDLADLDALREGAALIGKNVSLYARIYWPVKPGTAKIMLSSPSSSINLILVSPKRYWNCTTPCSLYVLEDTPFILLDLYIYSSNTSLAYRELVVDIER